MASTTTVDALFAATGSGTSSLTPTNVGDYSAGGNINGADFLAWQRSYGSTQHLVADGSADGVVDGVDYQMRNLVGVCSGSRPGNLTADY